MTDLHKAALQRILEVQRTAINDSDAWTEVKLIAREALASPDDSDPNAPWLTEAHTLCTDAGIMPGHISDRLVMLRAKYEAALAAPVVQECQFPLCHNKEYQDAVAAQVVAELYTGVLVPPGFALVPMEPTPEMVAAAGATPGMRAIDEAAAHTQVRRGRPISDEAVAEGAPLVQAYRAMLAAAPKPKEQTCN